MKAYCEADACALALMYTDGVELNGEMITDLVIPDGTQRVNSPALHWKLFSRYRENELAGIGNVADDGGDAVVVTVEKGHIVIKGAAPDTVAEVYNVCGSRVYTGYAGRIGPLPGGVYIVRVGSRVSKVCL